MLCVVCCVLCVCMCVLYVCVYVYGFGFGLGVRFCSCTGLCLGAIFHGLLTLLVVVVVSS